MTNEQEGIDLEDFELEVYDELVQLQKKYGTRIPTVLPLIVVAGPIGRVVGSLFDNLIEETHRKYWKKAREILSNKEVLEALCPVLANVSDDSFELIKAITPVLLTLIHTGVVHMEVSALLFAIIAFLILRVTIAKLCADVIDDD